MSRTNRSDARRVIHHHLSDEDLEIHHGLVPVDEHIANGKDRLVLAAVILDHREQLVAAARRLGHSRGGAEDIVQDLCLSALEGELTLSPYPCEALDELLAILGGGR